MDIVLGELKTRLEGEPIDNGELLGVKSAQLEEIKAHIKSSATLVDSMFAENPVQVVITRKTQGMRVTQAQIMVHACEELVAKMQAAINTRNTAIVGQLLLLLQLLRPRLLQQRR